jgi:signal transduction histidine kinase
MEKNYKEEKEVAEIREKALRLALAQIEEINEKREKDLKELYKTTKILLRRDFELHRIQEEREKELLEMDKTTKMLLRRDFELAKIREKREKELEELKISKQVAEEEKNKTLAIITNFADGILVFDEKEKLLLINPMAIDFLSLEKYDLIGKSCEELAKIDSLKPVLLFYGKENKKRELEVKDDLILELSAIPLARGTLVVLHDITRAKLIERTKSEFVSLAAHQLRTPLSAVKWIFTMLLDEELGKLTEEQKDFLKDGYVSNQRMINLVNDLLNVARIEEGRYIYNLALIDAEKLIAPVINSYKSFYKERNINFAFRKYPSKMPKVFVDVDKVRIVLENILENALSYTSPKGAVTVSLKYSKKEIEVSVKDTGMGIPESQQKNIFKKFFRAFNVVRKETDGTGLGLFISKNIIEAHHGRIWFESEENKGSAFHFTIPVGNSNIK